MSLSEKKNEMQANNLKGSNQETKTKSQSIED